MSSIRPAIPCKARTRTGEPCRNYAIVGGRVCFSHGGRAPQVRRAAQRRIAEAKAWKVLARQQKDWDTWRSGSMAALGQELHYGPGDEQTRQRPWPRDHLGQGLWYL
jgi:hypothetical protein